MESTPRSFALAAVSLRTTRIFDERRSHSHYRCIKRLRCPDCTCACRRGYTVYASTLDLSGKNAHQVKELDQFAKERSLDLRALELDVISEKSANKAIESILQGKDRLYVVVHNAGHIAYGPAEAFTTEQFAELYDINVLGTQRVNRAALPQLCKQGRGLLIWFGSTSTRGGTPP